MVPTIFALIATVVFLFISSRDDLGMGALDKAEEFHHLVFHFVSDGLCSRNSI